MAIVHGRGGKDCEDYEEDRKDERQRGSYQTELIITCRLSKVPEAVYDSVLSLAEKQKEERANT